MNGQQIDISFICPCHNLEPYIKRLLLSFSMLDYINITPEFIFILDACNDKTEDIIINYMKDTDYHILHCDEHSCGIARNRGMEIARGRYIWFVDGDDWIINPDILQHIIPLMDKNKYNIIKLSYISNYFKMRYDSMVWQYIFRKSVIKHIKFVREQPHEDIKFMRQVTKELGAENIPTYQIPTYFYNYKRPGSNMAQFIEKQKIE